MYCTVLQWGFQDESSAKALSLAAGLTIYVSVSPFYQRLWFQHGQTVAQQQQRLLCACSFVFWNISSLKQWACFIFFYLLCLGASGLSLRSFKSWIESVTQPISLCTTTSYVSAAWVFLLWELCVYWALLCTLIRVCVWWYECIYICVCVWSCQFILPGSIQKDRQPIEAYAAVKNNNSNWQTYFSQRANTPWDRGTRFCI